VLLLVARKQPLLLHRKQRRKQQRSWQGMRCFRRATGELGMV
jgi:hypothetical protein